MREIRSICNGLVLPQIEAADLAGHPDALPCARTSERTGTTVELSLPDSRRRSRHPAKICIYRFVQEALNNGFRHGGGLAGGHGRAVRRGA